MDKAAERCWFDRTSDMATKPERVNASLRDAEKTEEGIDN